MFSLYKRYIILVINKLTTQQNIIWHVFFIWFQEKMVITSEYATSRSKAGASSTVGIKLRKNAQNNKGD